MPVEIPEPIRAVAGLAATVLDRARHLPATVTGLPVRVAGLAMQASLRLQQEYAGLVVKGDELIIQISRPDDADPPWATFDDDVVEVADAITERVGVDVTAADDAATSGTGASGIDGSGSGVPVPVSAATEVALPPLPGATRKRPPRKASSAPSATRMGHSPSAFDLVEDVSSASAAAPEPSGTATTDSTVNGYTTASAAPVPGYDAFTLAQLRSRLRTFDAATLLSLLSYEREQRARAPYLTMLENRLNRSREQG